MATKLRKIPFFNMSEVLYDTFTVSNIFCDNVKMIDVGNNVFVATFGFSDRCGLYGELLLDVKRGHKAVSCFIDPKCDNVHCKVMAVDGHTAARGPNSETGRITDQTVGKLCESYPIFSAVVDVEFESVSGNLDESMRDNIIMVSYKSLKVTSFTRLRSWNYDPVKKYGPLGAAQRDVDKMNSFESMRRNIS